MVFSRQFVQSGTALVLVFSLVFPSVADAGGKNKLSEDSLCDSSQSSALPPVLKKRSNKKEPRHSFLKKTKLERGGAPKNSALSSPKDVESSIATTPPSLTEQRDIGSSMKGTEKRKRVDINLQITKRSKQKAETALQKINPSQEEQPKETSQLVPVHWFWEDSDKRDVILYTFSFLPSLKDLRLVSKRINAFVDDFLIQVTPYGKALAQKVWLNGPKSGTIENYKLTSALWYAIKHSLIVHERRKNKEKLPEDQISLMLEPVKNVRSYLEQYFAVKFPGLNDIPKFLEAVSELLNVKKASTNRSLRYTNPRTLATTGHRELTRLTI